MFYKQSQAFEHASSKAEPLHVFPYERPEFNGGRRYLVKTYEDFWDLCESLPETERTFYEIVEEGKPCYMYFDIEFNVKANLSIDGDNLMAIFFDFLFTEIKTELGISTTRSDVIELDSTTETYF